ncbi:hypothetical protein AVME950_10440 [Acidovorax sp. SUPP950]|uniref:hypothetical protein n=1 Tax=Acidovorax sp. SUPP950 TaxID=511901 RepID=UPI0023D07554|nr:hypothetical protein [Acidovorax sp. SUPP950]GKS75306.1 hypothetical protein AVME950_10440 [Acidovorax sp. SUPP950]
MNEQNPPVRNDQPAQVVRKAWTAPVVSFLAIEETANGTFGGNDGVGASTGS